MNSDSSMLVLVTIAASAVAGCTGRGKDVPDARPESAAQDRYVLTTEWDTVFMRGGVVDDSLLLMPIRLAANNSGIVVIDGHTATASKFFYGGEHIWTAGGQGAGPGEFRVMRDVHFAPNGDTWILDAGLARVTVLDTAGMIRSMIGLERAGAYVDDLARIGSDEFMIFTSDGDEPIVQLDITGKVRQRQRLPVPGFSMLHSLASQVITASDSESGVWTAAFQAGDGIVLLNADGTVRHRCWLTEPASFPEIESRKSGSGVTARLRDPVFTTWSVSISKEYVFALTARGDSALRMVDRFSISTGEYAGSYFLPMRVGQIAYYAGGFVVLFENPYPGLAYLVPRRKAEHQKLDPVEE